MAHKPQRRPLNDRQKALALADRPAPAPLDLCALFDLSPCVRMEASRKSSPSSLTRLPVVATFQLDERKIFIPGPPHRKKDGTLRETRIPVLLLTAQIFIASGNAPAVPVFRATNRGRTVLDCRTEKRLPLCEVERELSRLSSADAETLTGQLAEILRD